MLQRGDVQDAQGLLVAAEVTVPTGNLADGAYDSFGSFYQLAPWVVSDPENLAAEDEMSKGEITLEQSSQTPEEISEPGSNEISTREEKGKGRALQREDGIRVKARLSDRAKDVVVLIGKEESVRGLVSRIKEEAEVRICQLF